MTKKVLLFILEWSAVAVTGAGGLLASLNIYPLGPILLNLGALLFLIMSIVWRKWSLIAINALLLSIYAGGLLYKFLID